MTNTPFHQHLATTKEELTIIQLLLMILSIAPLSLKSMKCKIRGQLLSSSRGQESSTNFRNRLGTSRS
jgi:hypothetical protein